MKTLNQKLEIATEGTRGLVKSSLMQLRNSGICYTGKNQNRKTQKWTIQVCEVLSKNNIPFLSGNDAPKGGVSGEYVKLTSKGQLQQIKAENKKRIEEIEEAKKTVNSRLIESEETIIDFIKANRIIIDEKKAELVKLKDKNDKLAWQIKANSLIQFVSKNDFALGWKRIYTLLQTT